MEGSFNGLPPSKRFRLLHPQECSLPSHLRHTSPPQCLPAKKRLDSFRHHQQCHPTTSLCLPAKKRVWAPLPLSPVKPTSPSHANDGHEEEEEEEEEEFDDHCGEEKPIDQPEAAEITQVEEGEDEVEDDDGVTCAVCQSTDGDASDPIVFCDGCDLMVHASCYGNPLIKSIPEGDWFCLRCERKATVESNCSCCLCPVKGGAVKPTTDRRWAHVSCALLVPEVFFHDPEGRDGIDCSQIPKRRWKKDCYLCETACGCALECSEPKCGLGFHVSCGLAEGLCFEYKEGRRGTVVAGFCAAHTELWKKQQSTGKFKIVAIEDDHKGKVKA